MYKSEAEISLVIFKNLCLLINLLPILLTNFFLSMTTFFVSTMFFLSSISCWITFCSCSQDAILPFMISRKLNILILKLFWEKASPIFPCLHNISQESYFTLCLIIFVWQLIWCELCSRCCDLGIDIAQPGEVTTLLLRTGILSPEGKLPQDTDVPWKHRSWFGSVPLLLSMRILSGSNSREGGRCPLRPVCRWGVLASRIQCSPRLLTHAEYIPPCFPSGPCWLTSPPFLTSSPASASPHHSAFFFHF